MDLKYPLAYKLGNLETVNSNDEILSKIRNVFDTYLTERILNPRVGIDVGILFELPVRELITYQIETQLNLIENLKYNLYVSELGEGEFEIVVKVLFDDGTETFLNIPISF